MKKVIISMLLIVLMALSVASYALDTLKVAALPPGNLNNVINADTVAGGFTPPNRVYVLQQTTELDTVYFMTAPISVKGNVFMVGKINPTTGHPPVIVPSIAADNSSIGHFFEPQGDDTLSIKGLYFLGTRTDGVSFTGRFVSPEGDNHVFLVDRCVIENISGAGTPNVFDTWEIDHCSFYVTNSLFRNMHCDDLEHPGFSWVDPTETPCDTAKFYNNTFFVFGGYVLGSSGFGCTYVDFQHNTVFGTYNLFMSLPQMTNVTVKNNIFYNPFCKTVPMSWNPTPGGWGSGVFQIDSLGTVAADPYNFTEPERQITITNNAYWWSSEIFDEWLTIDGMGISGVSPLYRPDFISKGAPDMGTDNVMYPFVTFADNDSTDPGFDAVLSSTVATDMAALVEKCWVDGSAQGERSYYKPASNPPTWDDVPADWATTQGYPVPENLRYSNTLVGDDGKPLGDLNWFPEYTGISQPLSNSVPMEFNLAQNYPNPFNPTTQIVYTLPAKMKADLIIYDLTGREVNVIDQGTQQAGQHVVTFDGRGLSSGVYFYVLKTETFTESRKMLLLK
jgi:hypothetical protein